MDVKGLVTIGIPVYNRENYIAECLDSVIKQDYDNIELIIVNDGSTDRTSEIIKSYMPKLKRRFVNFEYIEREQNLGTTFSTNEILELSRGEYFTHIGSDDLLEHDFVSSLLRTLVETEACVTVGDCDFIDEEGRKISIYAYGRTFQRGMEFFTYPRRFDYKNKEIFGTYKTLIGGNYIPTIYLAKAKKLKEVRGFNGTKFLEDWAMWLKLSKTCKFVFLDKVLYHYRQHTSNTIRTLKPELIKDEINLLLTEKDYALKAGARDEYYFHLSEMLLNLYNMDKRSFIKNLKLLSKDMDFLDYINSEHSDDMQKEIKNQIRYFLR